MSISVNGQSCVPPGFRFHPTEEELLTYYLKKKVASESIDLDVIRDVDLNKLEPWDIQEKCRIGSGPQNDWYFFSHKDKKYPTGTRTNRATAAGFWKATGRDKVISTSFKRIGMRKTLVFYRGRAPHGQKSDWIMHEYRLDEQPDTSAYSAMYGSIGADQAATQEEGWVVCRVFKKKNLHHHTTTTTPHHSKAAMAETTSPSNCSSVTMTDHAKLHLLHSPSDNALGQILQCIGRSCKQDTKKPLSSTACSYGGFYGRFSKLPALEAPAVLLPSPSECLADTSPVADWAALDRLAACELNVLSDASRHMGLFDEPDVAFTTSVHGGSGDGDLWSLARSASSLPDDLANNLTSYK